MVGKWLGKSYKVVRKADTASKQYPVPSGVNQILKSADSKLLKNQSALIAQTTKTSDADFLPSSSCTKLANFNGGCVS